MLLPLHYDFEMLICEWVKNLYETRTKRERKRVEIGWETLYQQSNTNVNKLKILFCVFIKWKSNFQSIHLHSNISYRYPSSLEQCGVPSLICVPNVFGLYEWVYLLDCYPFHSASHFLSYLQPQLISFRFIWIYDSAFYAA